MNQSNLHLQQKQALMVRRSLSLVADDAFLTKTIKEELVELIVRRSTSISTHEIGTIVE